MEPLFHIGSLSPAKENSSIAGRVISSFGNEMVQLLAMVAPDTASPSHLGQNIDVKA